MKKIISLLLVLAMLFSVAMLTGCGNSDGGDKVVLKFNINENEEHGQGVLMATFKEKVEELSGGQVEVQIFYNSSLYASDASTPAVRTGELEMTNTSLQVTAEYFPALNMFASSYIFKNYDHMRKVMDSEIGENLKGQIQDAAGYYVLGYAYNGSRQLNLVQEEPVTTPADLDGVILRMPSSEAWIAVGESLGASVTPLAYGEVYTALQTGAIDAQDNPMPAVKTAKFYEVTKQLCLSYHVIDMVLVAINGELWDSLTEEQKGWLQEAANAAVAACDKTMLDNEAELISFFEDEGLSIVYPDVDAFSEYAYNYYVDNGLTADWDMDLYQQVQDMAE